MLEKLIIRYINSNKLLEKSTRYNLIIKFHCKLKGELF